jgi:hypothetical protein
MALGSTQPLTEMSSEIILGVKSGRRVGLITLPPSMSRMSENVKAWTSRNPKGLQGLYRNNFTFFFLLYLNQATKLAYLAEPSNQLSKQITKWSNLQSQENQQPDQPTTKANRHLCNAQTCQLVNQILSMENPTTEAEYTQVQALVISSVIAFQLSELT